MNPTVDRKLIQTKPCIIALLIKRFNNINEFNWMTWNSWDCEILSGVWLETWVGLHLLQWTQNSHDSLARSHTAEFGASWRRSKTGREPSVRIGWVLEEWVEAPLKWAAGAPLVAGPRVAWVTVKNWNPRWPPSSPSLTMSAGCTNILNSHLHKSISHSQNVLGNMHRLTTQDCTIAIYLKTRCGTSDRDFLWQLHQKRKGQRRSCWKTQMEQTVKLPTLPQNQCKCFAWCPFMSHHFHEKGRIKKKTPACFNIRCFLEGNKLKRGGTVF